MPYRLSDPQTIIQVTELWRLVVDVVLIIVLLRRVFLATAMAILRYQLTDNVIVIDYHFR